MNSLNTKDQKNAAPGESKNELSDEAQERHKGGLCDSKEVSRGTENENLEINKLIKSDLERRMHMFCGRGAPFGSAGLGEELDASSRTVNNANNEFSEQPSLEDVQRGPEFRVGAY